MAEPAPREPLALTLVTRRDCFLCEEFALALARWDAGRGLHTLRLSDADETPDHAERYGWRLPVLLLGDVELCAGRFEPSALERVLADDT